MRDGAYTLADLHFEYVRLACTKCDRKGRLRRDRLVEQYGAEIKLPDLRVLLADCPREGKFNDACGAYYVDLKPAD